jgi:hypothetical protein
MENQIENPIHKWRNYLDDEDYNYLFNFVECAKKKEKRLWSSQRGRIVVLCGDGGNGKNMMLTEIRDYLKNENCASSNLRIIFDDNSKQLFIDDIGMDFINDISYYDLAFLTNRILTITMSPSENYIKRHIRQFCKIINMKYYYNPETGEFSLDS